MNKKRRNSRRPNSPKDRGDRRPSKVEESAYPDRKSDGKNDFSWYNRNPQLTVAAASIPYPYRPGMRVEALSTPTTGNVKVQGYGIPGVMSLAWVPSVGYSNGPTDPASIAAREMYATVRAAFSGSLDADPPDFIIYMMALDSIFSYIGGMKRIYRIINAYSAMNYQTPDTLLKGAGLTSAAIENYRQNRTLLWQYTNQLIGMTRRFKCPAVFDIFNRHYWMNDNVYTDAPTPNSQFYMFHQVGYMKYKLAGDPLAGSCEVIPMTTLPATVEELYQKGKELVDALSDGDDCYLISGYLTRAYTDTPNFTVDELQEGETFVPLYEPEVLQQIENSNTLCPGNLNTMKNDAAITSCGITQRVSNNSIISKPEGTYDTSQVRAYPMISVRSDNPTVIDTIEATRLSATFRPDKSGASAGKTLIDCGTELPMCWNYFTNVSNNESGFAGSEFIQQVFDVTHKDAKLDAPVGLLTSVTNLASFDWAPRISICFRNTMNTARNYTQLIWDVHNVTNLTPEQLENIHRVCLFSEFNSFGMQ